MWFERTYLFIKCRYKFYMPCFATARSQKINSLNCDKYQIIPKLIIQDYYFFKSTERTGTRLDFLIYYQN